MTRRPTRRLAALLVAVPLGLSACSGGDVDVDAPEVNATPGDVDVDVPDVDAPDVDAPDIDAPDVDAPDIDAPDVDADVDVDANGDDTGEGEVDNAQ
jgi:hypothetical protein